MYVVGFELKLKCTVQSGINMANDKHELIIQYSTTLVPITLLSVVPVSENSSQNVESQNVNFANY